MNILHLDSGLFAEQSVSRQLSKQLVQQLQAVHPDAQVTYRDLVVNPINHLDAEILTAGATAENQRNQRQMEELALTEQLLEEVFAADIILLGAPLYNFAIPSQLKAWIDRIAQAGRTFRYTEQGPEGLLKGKKVYLASARGGIYSEEPAAAMEHQESYLKTLLGFIGITDITIIRAEGLNMGDTMREAAISQASEAINNLA